MPRPFSARLLHAVIARHHCSCISCCVGTGGSALRAADVHVAAAWTQEVQSMSRTADVLPRPAPWYAQPLATGPPRV